MAKILILSLVFPPDNVSTAHIMGDLARDLNAHGHSITVLTTTPHYNWDGEADSNQPLRNVWGHLLQKSCFFSIPVYHILMPKKGSNVLMRLIAWVAFHQLSTLVGIAFIPKPDLIIAPSPPLTIGVSAWIIGLFRGSRYIYNVQEIYPDIAVRLGAVRNRLNIYVLSRLENFVYKKAAVVTVIAPSMRHNLVGKRVPRKKIKVIPNFVDIEALYPLPKKNPFSIKHSIDDKFVVSYAGNIGVPQGLPTFVDAARLLQKESGIWFMLIGDGMQREVIRRRVEAFALNNIILLPYQPYSLVPQIYAASDVNLVPQTSEAGFDAVPSKVYRIMACSRPVIAVTEPSSDLASLVSEAGCGIVVQPGSARKLADAILWAYMNQNEWMKKGEAGRTHVAEQYTRKAITSRYDRLILDVLSCRDSEHQSN